MNEPRPLPEDTAWTDWAAGNSNDFRSVQEQAFRAGYRACEEDSVPQSYYDNAVAVGNAEKKRADEAEELLGGWGYIQSALIGASMAGDLGAVHPSYSLLAKALLEMVPGDGRTQEERHDAMQAVLKAGRHLL